MKVMLELLMDVSQLLGGVHDLNEIREEARPQMRALLASLHDEAERLLAPTPEPMKRENVFQRALEAIANERFEDAQAILEAGVKQFPMDAELHNHLGLVAWETGDLEAAQQHYGAAMACSFPESEHVDWFDSKHRPFLRATEGRALALYRLGRLDEALVLFDSLASMNPRDFSGCRYLAGEIRHTLGNPAAALDDYALVPAEPAVLYNQGLAFFECGRREDAMHALIAALVGNRHVAHYLIRRGDEPETSLPGYLASDAYAREFVGACEPLWGRAEGAIEFLRRVYEHPLTQSHLLFCTQNILDRVLAGGPSAFSEDWYAQMEQRPEVDKLIQRVLSMMDS
ncbi:MAG: tetratricopeptide repeat protein [bacterium]